MAEATPGGSADVLVQTDTPLQAIESFGACFNELGWTSLAALSAVDRESVLRSCSRPASARASRCAGCRSELTTSRATGTRTTRRKGDFALERFTIANDLETLVPFIKAAQEH